MTHCVQKGAGSSGFADFKMASSDEEYLETLITKLSLESDSKIRRALIELTKLTKNKEIAHLFHLKGGLKCLFTLIKRPNKSIADIALSTLANCALESGCRREVGVCEKLSYAFLFCLYMISFFYLLLILGLSDKKIGRNSRTW